MILVDTGPFVALFDPRDRYHTRCKALLPELREPLFTTVPVLTEAFHLLSPASRGSTALREFARRGGLSIWFFDPATLRRAFELMEEYADHPMDLADASLVAAAEELQVGRIFTLDRDDFSTYRVRRGRRLEPFELLP
ncbi:MAG TPA: PIN domain-containing protein [Thermoanaerobaculia bacterium]|nr:PIN domain-containing protein [Thermoanaerobaculia bacterium]